MPRAASPLMSQNGSMKTVWSPESRNADCPYQRMRTASSLDGVGLGAVGQDGGAALGAACASRPRHDRRERARNDRERERLVQPRVERLGDEVREEAVVRERRGV